jgi:preprotein translocase subunit SecA
VERAQKKVEENNFSIRKRLLEYDDVMNQQREVIYSRRRHALRGDRLKGEIFDYIEEIAEDWFDEFQEAKNLNGLKNVVRATLLSEPEISEGEFESIKKEKAIEKIIEAADEFYRRKEEMLGSEFMGRLERVAVLQTIDDKWREHLRVMDDLKEGIHLRAYGQKDPVLEYKGEAFRLFMQLLKEINIESVNFAFKYFPQVIERRVAGDAPSDAVTGDDGLPRVKRMAQRQGALRFQKSSDVPDYVKYPAGAPQAQAPDVAIAGRVQAHRREQPKIGRNSIVKVQYSNGTVKEEKYKKVERDIENGLCRVIDTVE